ncbi:MAG TPA: signal peptidase I [bacterium]|jgi:signal peptidase I|nr:signal peptidase [Patescibacteria group bacterium]HRH32166.1 signal peptidase I [bacterium]
MAFFDRKKGESTPSFMERMLGPTLGAVATFVLEIVQIAALALAIILPVRYFLVQPFIVKGVSMEPNFEDGEYLIIDELTFHFREPERGEIVVFHPPSSDEKQFYIKRVIGLPGETVEVNDGKVTIYNASNPNGFTLTEPYLDSYTTGRDKETLGEGEYYLMGDNRDASFDSRAFGPVPRTNFTGRVWVRGLPLEKMSSFPVPEYQE